MEPPLDEPRLAALLEAMSGGRRINEPPIAEQRRLVEGVPATERAALIDCHLWLVVAIARQSTDAEIGPCADVVPAPDTPYGSALRRRVAAGYRGLARAAPKWDPDRGFKFGTFASWWIRTAIERDRDRGRP